MRRAAQAVAIWVLGLASAHAKPTITIDASVPFTADELSDALAIRMRESNARVHIARSGDVILISVGDRANVIDANTQDLARAVALVVLSLADAPSPAAVADAPALTATPAVADVPATPSPSRHALRFSVGYQRNDGGLATTPFLASLATSLTANARFVVSAGIDEHVDGNTHGDEIETNRSIVARLGLEGRFGPVGLEAGGAGFAFHTCGGGDVGVGDGVYGTARIYVPVSRRLQVIVEAGGYYVDADIAACDTTITFDAQGHFLDVMTAPRGRVDEYAGHFGIGVEWAL